MKISYEAFKEALKIVNAYKHQLEDLHETSTQMCNDVSPFFGIDRNTKLKDVKGLSPAMLNRLYTTLNLNSETTVAHFENIKSSDLKKFRYFGNKSVEKIKELCLFAGFKMLD